MKCEKQRHHGEENSSGAKRGPAVGPCTPGTGPGEELGRSLSPVQCMDSARTRVLHS